MPAVPVHRCRRRRPEPAACRGGGGQHGPAVEPGRARAAHRPRAPHGPVARRAGDQLRRPGQHRGRHAVGAGLQEVAVRRRARRRRQRGLPAGHEAVAVHEERRAGGRRDGRGRRRHRRRAARRAAARRDGRTSPRTGSSLQARRPRSRTSPRRLPTPGQRSSRPAPPYCRAWPPRAPRAPHRSQSNATRPPARPACACRCRIRRC